MRFPVPKQARVKPPPEVLLSTRAIGITIDGGGSVVTTGQKGYAQCPFGKITRWTLMADRIGSCVLDVWRTSFLQSPPTVGNTITGTGKPALVSAIKSEDRTLKTWDKKLKPGDVIGFNVDSASVVTRLSLILWVEVVVT